MKTLPYSNHTFISVNHIFNEELQISLFDREKLLQDIIEFLKRDEELFLYKTHQMSKVYITEGLSMRYPLRWDSDFKYIFYAHAGMLKHTHTHTHTHTYIYIYIYIYIHQTHTYIYTQIHMHAYKHPHTYTHDVRHLTDCTNLVDDMITLPYSS